MLGLQAFAPHMAAQRRYVPSTLDHVEDLEKYCRGGFHPVHLGDKLDQVDSTKYRYEVIHKLGYGGFSTVWLAHDLIDGGYVALKIVRASRKSYGIPPTVQAIFDSHPAKIFVTELRRFLISGPNGRHHVCLVLPVAGPSLPALSRVPYRLRPAACKTFARIQVKNVLPTSANPDLQSPQVFATGVNMPESARKPYIGHFRAYFCEAFHLIKPQKRVQSDKFEARAEKARLICYADLHGKIYWVWNPVTGKVIRASAVRFNEGPDSTRDEDAFVEYEAVFTDPTTEEEEKAAQHCTALIHPDKTVQRVNFREPKTEQRPQEQQPEEQPPQHEDYERTELPSEKGDQQPQLPTPEPSPEPTPEPEVEPDHGNEEAEPFDTDTVYHSILEDEAPVPPDNPLVPGMEDLVQHRQEEEHNADESVGRTRTRPRWLPAMKKQDDSLCKHNVYELVKKRPGITILPSKWVFDEKTSPGHAPAQTRPAMPRYSLRRGGVTRPSTPPCTT
ncbi:hypothetical protein VTG60DRAFT_6617 [Thermothelomyces hinnuleus]